MARYGAVANTLVATNERILYLGRLCKATTYPPGYAPQLLSCPFALRACIFLFARQSFEFEPADSYFLSLLLWLSVWMLFY